MVTLYAVQETVGATQCVRTSSSTQRIPTLGTGYAVTEKPFNRGSELPTPLKSLRVMSMPC